MDFDLPEELQSLKDNLRRFVDRELIPIERETLDGATVKPDMKAALHERGKPLGLWLFDVPEEYGGQGFGLLAKVVVWSEFSRTIALPSRNSDVFTPTISPMLYQLNEDQKKRYLLPVIAGNKRTAFAQTEPDAGGDPASMRTTAVRDGDDYVLNGTKRFITGAKVADFLQVIAVTDPEKGSRGGLSTFLVDMDTPGVDIIREQDIITDDKPCEILFKDARVPAINLVGEEGEGFRRAQHWINVGRIRHGARSMGIIERCLELGASYAKQRVTFGQPLADRQAVQWMLVDMFTHFEQLKLMVYRAATNFDRGRDIRHEAYMCKMFGDTRAYQAADACMQIHGGLGMTTDLPLERFWRDQRTMIITEGPTEILKMALARHVLNEFG
jgi:acyl-CoA dehydrogenase